MGGAYICHHGILGQKWGVRKGPPYPIGPSDHSAAEKKAGWRKSLDNGGAAVDNKGRVRIVRSDAASGKKASGSGGGASKPKREAKGNKSKPAESGEASSANAETRKGLTSGQKKAIAIGATAVALGLATYGAYKLGYLDKPLAYGKDKAGELLEKLGDKAIRNGAKHATGEVAQNAAKQAAHNAVHQTAQGVVEKTTGIIRDPKTGFRVIHETLNDSLRNANPLKGTIEGKNNCTYCSVAGFLRTQGYDVVARSSGGVMQNLGGVLESCFQGVKVYDGSAMKFAQSPAAAAEMLKKRFGDNASGAVCIDWKRGGGHAFSWQIVNGIVEFLDYKDGSRGSSATSIWSDINPNGSLQFARLDGLEIIPNAVREIVEER